MSSSHPSRLALVALASMLASEMWSATSDDVPRAPGKLVFRGVPIEAQEESVKCDIKHVSGVSLRRLVDCDSATYITIPKKTDLSVIRFEIRPENPEINQGRRAGLRDMLDAVAGEEVWYRFSTLVPRDFPKGAPQVVVAQWHEQLAQGEPSRRPPLAHRLVDGVFIVTLWNDETYDRSSGKGHGIILFQDPGYAFGSVYEYVYRIVWSPVGQGNVTGWRRGQACSFADTPCKPGQWASIYLVPRPYWLRGSQRVLLQARHLHGQAIREPADCLSSRLSTRSESVRGSGYREDLSVTLLRYREFVRVIATRRAHSVRNRFDPPPSAIIRRVIAMERDAPQPLTCPLPDPAI